VYSPGEVAENRALRNSAGLKAIQGESKIIGDSLWEHEKLWSSTEMLRWTEMLKLYFAPVLSRSGAQLPIDFPARCSAHPRLFGYMPYFFSNGLEITKFNI
jgi:hypothetical protein